MKTGLAYYNVDTDRYQDRRIKRLKNAFKRDGLAVYDYILCEIYRDKGCFLVWDDDTAFDVADYLDMKDTTVKEIVTYCCNVGLFNKELLARGSVLSSPSIQRRYTEMCKRAKRKEILIPEEYRLLPEESKEVREEVPNPPEVSDKEKKSKVEERKGNESKELSISPGGDFAAEREKILAYFFFERKLVCPQYETEKFWNHYEARDWEGVRNRLAVAKLWRQTTTEEERPKICRVQADGSHKKSPVYRLNNDFLQVWKGVYEEYARQYPTSAGVLLELYGIGIADGGILVLNVSEGLSGVVRSLREGLLERVRQEKNFRHITDIRTRTVSLEH